MHTGMIIEIVVHLELSKTQ